MAVIFVGGIDTGIGKTYAAGLIARYLGRGGGKIITQKLVQTGCTGVAEDILLHRALMGTGLFPEDIRGLTCPYVFAFPASPHLAAQLESAIIDPGVISGATRELAARYDHVVLEGVGGFMVPLTGDMLVLDYLALRKHSVVLVSSSRLGSINHTLLAIEALHARGLDLRGIVYRRIIGEDPQIAGDTKIIIARYLAAYGYASAVVDMPEVSLDAVPDIDFSRFGL